MQYSPCYFLFICLIANINANILLSICYVISKPGKICTRNPIDFKLFQKYCMIDCIKRLWKVDKNAKGVVVVLKWFVDLIYKLSNSNWTWPFVEKIFLFFTKYTLFAEKNHFIWKKCFILKIFFTEKKTVFTEKNINENAKNISHFRNIFLHRKCLCYKWNINLSLIYPFWKKKISDHKKYIC